MEKTKLQWHPAFGAALRITLQDEMRYLEMHEEHLLSKKPLQIDVLIIKKLQDVKIKKTIGRIFRKHNIIEYKSPDAHFCVQSLSAESAPPLKICAWDQYRISGRRDLLSERGSDPHAASDHSSDVR